MVVALRLAKEGYYGGDPEKALNARVDFVLNILDYIKFLNKYESVDYELNKAKS